MKQRITPEQLAELSDEQREKLMEWVASHYGIMFDANDDLVFMFDPQTDTYYIKDNGSFCPLLSIGQMIELIKEHDSDFLSDFMVSMYLPKAVIPHNADDQKFADVATVMLNQVELCDALWEAVKQVL